MPNNSWVGWAAVLESEAAPSDELESHLMAGSLRTEYFSYGEL